MKRTALLIVLLITSFFPSEAWAERKIPILVYHSIAEYKGTGQKELYVTPENFEKQMRFLKANGFTLLTFERWEETGSVGKPIFLTFDDGYKNNLTAFSVLQKIKDDSFNPSATFFIISDFIGNKNRLTEKDLKKLADSGMISIQSHTATHPDLVKARDYTYELQGSKQKIRRITGKPVIAISYPYGNANKKVIEEVKKYYRYGLTTTPGPFIIQDIPDENYQLPRTYVKYSTSIEEFAKIVGQGGN